jgi:HD-GYP domain-containing protein (c-di-GMP phosphodiesterase class II)
MAAKEKGAPIDDLVIRVALEHHERFHGHGYPYQKKGRFEDDEVNGIHINSRYVAIADAYSALLMKRVYKPALSPKRAIELMSQNAEKDFDMEIYESFIGSVKKSLKVIEGRHNKVLEGGGTINYSGLKRRVARAG